MKKKVITQTNLLFVFFLVIASVCQVSLFFFRSEKRIPKPAYKNTLHIRETSRVEDKLIFTNCENILKIQVIDRNLRIYNHNHDFSNPCICCSVKSNIKKDQLILQTAGNLIVSAEKITEWNTNTHSIFLKKFKDSLIKPIKLVLKNDGSIKLHTAKNTIVWSSK